MGISAMQRSRRASPVLSGDWPRRCLWGLPCTSAPVPAAARLPWPLESTIRSAASAPCGPAPPPPSYESPLTPPSGERPICRSQFWLYSCRESKRLLVKSCNQIMLMAKTVVRWMMPYLHLRLLISISISWICFLWLEHSRGMHKAVLGQAADLPIHRAEEPESPSHTSVSLTGKEKSSRKHDRVDWTREEQPQKCSKLVSVEPRRV
ncbi:uncharacterized protein [Lolium perenne]|uniref:uncharacterized protein isoform X2 n=1 Tax=Lolium perenne TaxID=4522 RepID=UPI0021F61B58|nr:uncharacterized protein LOC127316573 isoform X2 [Lolium perenne]